MISWKDQSNCDSTNTQSGGVRSSNSALSTSWMRSNAGTHLPGCGRIDWFPLDSFYHSPAANGLRAMHFIVDNKFLRGSNPKPLMSALGQKQTLAHVRVMSALPSKADIESA